MRTHSIHTHPASHPRHRRALTFMELCIALSITAVVSLVLAVLMNATAAGTNSQQDGRRALARMQAIKAQVSDALANARSILAVGTNYVVYWTGDSSTGPSAINGAVNLSELHLLQVDTSTGKINLWSVSWPAGYTTVQKQAADSAYAANSNWYNAATAAKTGGFWAATPLGTGATSLSASLDNATPTSAKMINIEIEFNDGVASRAVVASATLRSPVAPW